MKRILKAFLVEIYVSFISSHISLAVFILTFLLSCYFLSDYNAGIPFLLSIIVMCVFSWVFDKYL